MWTPNDSKKFKQKYNDGLTHKELAAEFHSTRDKVQKYVYSEIAAGRLTGQSQRKTLKSTDIDGKLLEKLKKGKHRHSVIDLANAFEVSPNKIEGAVSRLQAENYLIEQTDHSLTISDPVSGHVSAWKPRYEKGNRIKFALVSDAHLCSKYEDLENLTLFYELAHAEGCRTFYDCGNWIDGESRFNKSDLKVHGLGNQVNYWAENWPRIKGVKTHFIAGDDHEGWYTQREGIDIGKFAQNTAREAGRTDLEYLGYMEHDIHFESPTEGSPTILRLLHGGGGSSYAISYTAQKIIESYTGGEKPHILCIGHYHKMGYFFNRGVHAVLAGCFQHQSPFMRKKRLAAHMGGWIIEFVQDVDGTVLEFNPRFYPFYEGKDDKKWVYQM